MTLTRDHPAAESRLMPCRLSPLLLLAGWLLLSALTLPLVAEQPLRFNRDIRPILTDKCFACHGLDQATLEADLRLDDRQAAIDAGAIVPGEPEESELMLRIETDDQSLRMPPVEGHKQLTKNEVDVLRRWIQQGAGYESHWAYTPMQRIAPAEKSVRAHSHPIDRYISAKLTEVDIDPLPPADLVTLVRRLTYDLTGMPPTLQEVQQFAEDAAPASYDNLVGRLLDSPRYGERMAVYWLDLVRYADTVGYHGDQEVSQSPYRDYVIKAFNENLSYDRFIREQLAGDLLPEATLDQRVASGYNRLNQTTEEGGSQAKEYLAIYFADRVRNVSQVFMGATVGCAQCHDHKYDPYTLRDFYSLGAFFADLDERGVYGARSRPPMIPVPSIQQQQQLVTIRAELEALKQQRMQVQELLLPEQSVWEQIARQQTDALKEQVQVWIDDDQGTGGRSEGEWNFITADQGPVYRGKQARRQQSKQLVQHFFLGAERKVTPSPGTKFYAWVFLDPADPPQAVMLQLNDGQWDHRAVWGNDAIGYGKRAESWAGYQRQGELPSLGQWVRLEVDAQEIGLKPGSEVSGMAFTQFGGTVYWDQAGWLTVVGLPQAVADALQVNADARTPDQARALTQYFINQADEIIALDQQREALRNQQQVIESEMVQTVVSRSVTPRQIRVLPRGDWMDDSGEVVQPAIPAYFGELSSQNQPLTRLDLADWLCNHDHPLTARTMVNRIWGLLFGRGICASVDDLGGQGTYPSHPELLDYLALYFIESGWDIKQLIRHIVASETYKRSSRWTEELRLHDPYNELLARQSRFRIDAEMIRDTALLHSGLLVEQIGGVSTKPYQPAKYYAQLNFPRREYQPDNDQNQYRRGVYTHWQRTFLHPMLKAFDAPSREECTAARSRSNTPVQALVLLNDPSFVEAARVFAQRIIRAGGPTPETKVLWAYQTILQRVAEPEIAEQLLAVYESHREHYGRNPSDVGQLLAVGNAPVQAELESADIAAWTAVARVIFNLHETSMRY